MTDTTIPVGTTGKSLAGWDTGNGIDEYVRVRNRLVIREYDAVYGSDYTADGQPRTVVYKAVGVTVSTVTLVYDGGAAGGNLLSAVRT